MRTVRNLVVVGVVLAGLTASPPLVPAAAQSSSEKPQAVEVGVTPTEIRIACDR